MGIGVFNTEYRHTIMHYYAHLCIIPLLLGQCLKDTFNVRPSHGIKVPTVCGINTGTHSKSILSYFSYNFLNPNYIFFNLNYTCSNLRKPPGTFFSQSRSD